MQSLFRAGLRPQRHFRQRKRALDARVYRRFLIADAINLDTLAKCLFFQAEMCGIDSG